ncbi:HU family DNA-binding protein [Youngiibacter fragilis]|uniref:Transcriptional regulator n=1 Tax=Youngiibacter fragilis 232.1 TaxID=994573 RepID=V7I310_9CLOT|nr:HU family DNA-binding protein [Youngiibacter fragilis]ETA80263.1 transcriptional regulator [Youngiibacter fragilis 232.1]
MNKADLVAKIAEKTAFTKKDSELALKAAIETIVEALSAGEKVQLSGFGTFEVKERKARVGRNPKTNEEIQIPAFKQPAFKAGKDLKEIVNE